MKMPFVKLFGAGLIMLVCGVSHARSIAYDCGQYDLSPTVDSNDPSVTSFSYSVDGVTLTVSPGADNPETTGGASCYGVDSAGQWMTQGGFYSNPFLVADWQVLVTNTSPSQFTVEFLYDSNILTSTSPGYDPGCAGETASLGLSTGGSYSYKGACAGSGDYLFTFNSNGQLVGSSPFPTSSTASAPEIDPASAASGLTLLFGLITVMRGRRQPATSVAIINS